MINKANKKNIWAMKVFLAVNNLRIYCFHSYKNWSLFMFMDLPMAKLLGLSIKFTFLLFVEADPINFLASLRSQNINAMHSTWNWIFIRIIVEYLTHLFKESFLFFQSRRSSTSLAILRSINDLILRFQRRVNSVGKIAL